MVTPITVKMVANAFDMLATFEGNSVAVLIITLVKFANIT